VNRSRAAVVPATLAAIAAGVGVAVQTSINGHVSATVGSPVLATAINHASALCLSVVVALAMGAFPRAVRSLRTHRADLRWWWFLGGFMGFAGVLAIISVTPLVGVVIVAVAVTLGQLAGSLVADSGGLGPGGRRALTPLRLLGVGVAIIAVVVGAFGRFTAENVWIVPVIVVAGILIALQQAANGWLVVVTGEFAVMSVINFVISGVFVGIALLTAALIAPPDFGAIPVWAPLGGLIGAVIGVLSAVTLRVIGVLSAMLSIAAGNAFGGIFLDLVFPVDAVGLTTGSVMGAVLAVIAVALAGLGAVSRRRRAAVEPAPADAALDVAESIRPGESP